MLQVINDIFYIKFLFLRKKKITIKINLLFNLLAFCRIYLAVNSLPGLVKALAIDDAPAALKVLIIEPLTECIQDMDKYQEMIENTLDMNALESKEYRVKPEFNDDLVGNDSRNLSCNIIIFFF